jgi:hypothetical protein
MIDLLFYLNVTDLNWTGRRLNLKMMAFLKALILEVYGTKNDPYILATQARKVFYLADTKLGKSWYVF